MFDLNQLLEAHYTCEYDFGRARLYSADLDLSKAERYCSLPLPGPDLDIDPFPIAVLFIAAAKTGSREFLAKATAMVEAIYALPNWRYPHHQHMNQVDLGMAVVTARLAHVYEEIQGIPALTDIRQRMAQQVITRGLDPFYEQVTNPNRWGWARVYYNWRSYICADMGRAAFRFADQYPCWRDCLAEAIKGCLAVADTACPDGGWEEGVGYWGMAFGQTANFAEELYAASSGHVDLFSHPYFRVAGDFALYCSMPGNSATYGFSDGYARRPRRDLMQSLAWHFSNPYWQWCADRSDERLPCLYGPAPQAMDPRPLPSCKHFRGIDVAILRTGWSDTDTVVGFRCGPRRIQTHHHLDANSLVVFHGPDPLLDEVRDCSPEDCAELYTQLGYAPDTSGPDATLGEAATIAHSTLLVAGQGQLQGKDEWGQFKPTYRTRSSVPLSHGELLPRDCTSRIVAFQHTPDLSFVMGEAADSYPSGAHSFCRTVLLIPTGETIIVDRIRAADKVDLCSLLHTSGDLAQLADGSFEIHSGTTVARLGVTAMSAGPVHPDCRAVPWRLKSGSQRHLVAVQVHQPSDWLWLIYDLRTGACTDPVVVQSAAAEAILLGRPTWNRPIKIRAAGWFSVRWASETYAAPPG